MSYRIRNSIRLIGATLCLAALSISATHAESFPLPSESNSLVGKIQTVKAVYEDTLSDIGRRFGIGYEEMISANPGVDPWLPGAGVTVVIPSQYILPNAPRVGIVVNLPEHRLYYYPPAEQGKAAVVITYPISVGKMDWKTPIGVTHIVDKKVKPSWYPPESVRAEHEADGNPLPKVIPPGPDNPLGEYAMRLGIPGGAYLIHGTNKPVAVGMPITHGCIRMFPEDIEALFKMTPLQTPVRIMNQANKVAWQGDTLYLEVHPALADGDDASSRSLTNVTRMLVAASDERKANIANIDWAQAEKIFNRASGVPEQLHGVTLALQADAKR